MHAGFVLGDCKFSQMLNNSRRGQGATHKRIGKQSSNGGHSGYLFLEIVSNMSLGKVIEAALQGSLGSDAGCNMEKMLRTIAEQVNSIKAELIDNRT
ncbi:conserved protein of unknown function [Pseudomonas marincola]|uniref:Uncharacterized protein n=2 Tax=Pseudomonas TaxID=286 RepID=A0A653E7P6_9PSED|nr:conserved protein of unknown function [Pseudomonas marincola]